MTATSTDAHQTTTGVHPARWRAALAGVLSVGLVLGVSELFAAVLEGVPSLVLSVGSALIPFVPTGLERWAIDTFGTSDKFVLNLGTTVITLAVGAWAGLRARSSRTGAVSLFVVFGVLGWLAATMQPLVNPIVTLTTTVVVVVVGMAALRAMLGAASPTPQPASDADADAAGGRVEDARRQADADLSRRRFVAMTAGVGAAAVVTAGAGRMLVANRGGPSASDIRLPEPATAVAPPGPAAAFEQIDGLTPIIIANEDFYRIDTRLAVPQIDPEQWSLRVHGLVDEELTLTYDDILAMPLEEHYITLSCVSNEVGGDLVGNARWLGIRLADVLERAGVASGGEQVVGRAIDGFTVGFPTEVALDGRDALIAIGMNGEPLPDEHGFPARLVVPGLYGYVSATKWLTEIELAPWDFDAYWVPRGWDKRGPAKTASRIDVARPADDGEILVAGVAWDPHQGISKVEVRIDDGDWTQAERSEPLSEDAWVQWRTTFTTGAGGAQRAEVRAYNGDGDRQPPGPVDPFPDGSEGWHSVPISA